MNRYSYVRNAASMALVGALTLSAYPVGSLASFEDYAPSVFAIPSDGINRNFTGNLVAIELRKQTEMTPREHAMILFGQMRNSTQEEKEAFKRIKKDLGTSTGFNLRDL